MGGYEHGHGHTCICQVHTGANICLHECMEMGSSKILIHMHGCDMS